MANRTFPLDMPIQVFSGDGSTPSSLKAPWSQSLSIGSVCVLYQNSAKNYPLGLYLKSAQAGGPWTYMVPYHRYANSYL